MVDGAGFEPGTFFFSKREPSLRENSLIVLTLAQAISPPFLAPLSRWLAIFYVALANREVNSRDFEAGFHISVCERALRICVNTLTFTIGISHEAFTQDASLLRRQNISICRVREAKSYEG